MALTTAQQTDAYRFFAVAFQAAPGVTYMNQIADAYINSHATTQEVVNAFVSKSQFTAIYPIFYTNAQFAEKIVENIVGSEATTAAKTQAKADIVAALNSGLSRGEVVYTIFNNLANKAADDADWGATATKMANQVAVAQYYTETLLGDSTDLSALQRVIAGVSSTTNVTGTAALDAAIASGGGSSNAGATFNLTSTVGETASGTAGDDIFTAGTTNTGATLNDGDIINGGSGADTLQLTAQGATAIAALNSVEAVDVRLLSAQTLDAISWSGTTSVTVNNNSINDLTLTVNNASQATRFNVNDDANVVVNYLDSTGSGDTAILGATNGGVSGSAATFTVSATEAVTLGVSGTNIVAISASDTALKDVSVSGVGTLSLTVSETSLSGVSLAAFSGTSTITLGGASNVNATGGAGADTFAFGTTFNGLDTVGGGDGADTLTATVQGIVGFTRVTSVETVSLTVAGTTVADGNGNSFSTLNVVDVQGSSDLTVNSLGTVEINLASFSTAGNVTLDYSGGVVANIDLVGTGAQTYSAVSLTDASGVDISNDGASGTQTFTSLTVDSDAKSLTINSGSGATTVTAASGAGLTSLSVTAGKSGVFSNTTLVASALTSVALNAQGASANATLGALSLNTASITIGVAASGDYASASIGALTFGGSGSTQAISVAGVGSGLTVNAGTITAGANGATTLTVDLSGGDASASVGNIAIGGSAATLGVSVAAGASSDVSMGSITVGSADAATATTLDLSFNLGSGDLSLATAQATTITSISGAAGNNATATITAVSANAVSSITLGGSGALQIGTLLASASVGAISVTTGTFSASVVAPTIGAITVAGDGFTLAASATKTIGAIVVGSDNSGAVSITNSNLSASFGTITLGGTGTVTIDLGNATGVGAISTVALTGQFTLDAGSATGQVIATLGGATSDVTVSLAGSRVQSLNGDLYTLSAGTGANTFKFQSTANNDITIQGFQVGTGDSLRFSTAGFDLGQAASASVLAASAAGALGVVYVTGASVTIGADKQVIVLATGTYADASAVAVALKSTYTAQAGTATTAGLDFIVVWADTNGDAHVSVVDLQASAAQGAVLFTSVAGTHFTDLALLDDTSIAAFSGGTQFYSY